MTPEKLLQIRAQRITQMAEKLGIQLSSGTEASRELRDIKVLGSCLSCRHEGACCAFTDGDDFPLAAPDFCLNKATFDRLLKAEHDNPALSQSEIDYLMALASSITFTGESEFPIAPTEYCGAVDDCGRPIGKADPDLSYKDIKF